MSILINGEELVLTGKPNVGTEMEQLVKGKIEEIRKTFKDRFPLKFRFEDKMVSETTMVDSYFQDPKKMKVYPSRPISLTAEVIIDNVRSTITWCKTRKYNERKNKWLNTPKSLNHDSSPTFIKGVLDITVPDADLAFFLLYCHPNIANTFDCAEIKRNTTKKEYFYKFVDDQKAAIQLVEKDRQRIKVYNIILNEMNAEQVKNMAIIYDIPRAEMEHEAVLRNQLWGMINGKADKADSYENVYADFTAKFEKLFKKVEIPKVTTPKVEGTKEETPATKEPVTETPKEEEVENPPVDEFKLKDLIYKCKEAGVAKPVGMDSANLNRRMWMLTKLNGSPDGKIVNIISDDPTEDLYKFLSKEENKDLIENLKFRLQERINAK